jgi:integrase
VELRDQHLGHVLRVDEAHLPVLPDAVRRWVTVVFSAVAAVVLGHGIFPAPLPERLRALALLGGYSGLRWSELVLKRDDLDLEARTVRVDERLTEVGGGGPWSWGKPKTTDSARTVNLPAVVVKPLAEHLLRFPPLRSEDDPRLEGLLFHSEGSPIRRHLFRKQWRRACEAVNVPAIRLEWLRHTAASLAYAASRDLKLVSKRLGHTSTRMVDTIYLSLYQETGRELAEAIDVLVRKRLSRS